MIMKAQPIEKTIIEIKKNKIKKGINNSLILMMSPQGLRLTHQYITFLAKQSSIIILCGRYQGIDQRIIDKYVDKEISLGDFILSGGEIAAIAIIDALIRQIPGSVNNKMSILKDSFSNGILDYPHYTRPKIYNGVSIPNILQSGHHKKIEEWRRYEAIKNTLKKRPDLIKKARKNKLLSDIDEIYIKNFYKNFEKNNK